LSLANQRLPLQKRLRWTMLRWRLIVPFIDWLYVFIIPLLSSLFLSTFPSLDRFLSCITLKCLSDCGVTRSAQYFCWFVNSTKYSFLPLVVFSRNILIASWHIKLIRYIIYQIYIQTHNLNPYNYFITFVCDRLIDWLVLNGTERSICTNCACRKPAQSAKMKTNEKQWMHNISRYTISM